MNENSANREPSAGNGPTGIRRTAIPASLMRNIPVLNLWSFFRNCFFSIPVIVLFWQDNGLSISQVMFLQSLFALFVVILEVPSGYLADLFGRSRLLFVSAFFQTAAIIVYSLGTGFPVFLAAEGLFAICISLSSGADSAFIYDTLKAQGREDSYAKVMGRNHFFELFALGLSSVLGGFIGKFDLRLTIILSIPFFASTILVGLAFREPPVHAQDAVRKGFPPLPLVWDTVVKNGKVRSIIVFGAVLSAFNNGALWLYQPYFSLTKLPVWSFGLIFASFNAVAALSAHTAGKLLAKTGLMPLMLLLIAASTCGYFLLGSFVVPLGFIFVFLQQWVRGTQYVVFSDAVNRETESSVRATVLSVQNLVSRLGYAAVIPIIGITADSTSIPHALIIGGAAGLMLCALAVIPVMVHRKKEEHRIGAF